MNMFVLTISCCFLIFTFFACKWGFRALVLILAAKLLMQLKEKGLDAFKPKPEAPKEEDGYHA
jgi:hypothetical protein